MTPAHSDKLSTACLIAGFLSIVASVAIWLFYKADDTAHAERFGIFIGLWAPTFLILSSRWRRTPARTQIP